MRTCSPEVGGFSNAGLITSGGASLLVDTLYDLRLTRGAEGSGADATHLRQARSPTPTCARPPRFARPAAIEFGSHRRPVRRQGKGPRKAAVSGGRRPILVYEGRVPALARAPFPSRDVDFCGHRRSVRQCAQRLGGRARLDPGRGNPQSGTRRLRRLQGCAALDRHPLGALRARRLGGARHGDCGRHPRRCWHDDRDPLSRDPSDSLATWCSEEQRIDLLAIA